MAWSLFQRSTARYQTDKESLRQIIQDHADDLNVGREDELLEGRQRRRLFDVRFEWEIEPGDGSYYLVTEHQYLPRKWYAPMVLGLSLLAVGQLLLRDPWRTLIVGTGVVSFVIWGTTMIYYAIKNPSVMSKTKDINEKFTAQPARPILLVTFILLVLLVPLLGHITLNLVLRFGYIMVLLVVFLLIVGKTFVDSIITGDVMSTYLPDFAGDYIASLFTLLIVPSALLTAQDRADGLVYGWLLVVQAGTIYVTYRLLQRRRPVAYHEFLERTKGLGELHRVFVIGAATVLSYLLFVYVGLILYRFGGIVTTPFEQPLPALTILLVLVPVAYIPIGLLLQSFSFLLWGGYLRRNSSPIDSEGEAEVRCLDVDYYEAASYSTGRKDYIFVSRPVLDDFEEDEIQAILAHEEAHVTNGDALLTFLIPIVSIVTLTGKNIFYTVIDFRGREIAADAYATKKVGEESLTRALEKFAAESETTPAWFGITPNFVPFSGTFDIDHFLEKWFGMYFGAFALAQAHPSLEERVEKIGD